MSFFNNKRRKELTKLLSTFASCPPMSRLQAAEYWQKLNRLQALSQIQIEDIDYKGLPNPIDESITLRNHGNSVIDISNWRIHAGSPKQAYIFPEETYLFANEKLKIDTSGKTEHSFNSNQPIWNNRGDIGSLIDDEGQIVSSLAYGNSADKKLIINHINFDGQEYRREGDEFVEISNISDNDVMLAGWRIEATTNDSAFVFSNHTKLEAHSTLRVYTNKTDLQENEYSFNSPKAIWNNVSGGCQLFNYLDNEMFSYYY